MSSHISTEAMERSRWGSFTHQEIFVMNFLVKRDDEANAKKAKKAGAKKRSNDKLVCLYVCRAGKVTLTLNPRDLQVSPSRFRCYPLDQNTVRVYLNSAHFSTPLFNVVRYALRNVWCCFPVLLLLHRFT